MPGWLGAGSLLQPAVLLGGAREQTHKQNKGGGGTKTKKNKETACSAENTALNGAEG